MGHAAPEARALSDVCGRRATNESGLRRGGLGAPQDYALAHMWFNLASSPATNAELRQMAVQNRDQVAAKMTPDQIAEAQRMASEWKPK